MNTLKGWIGNLSRKDWKTKCVEHGSAMTNTTKAYKERGRRWTWDQDRKQKWKGLFQSLLRGLLLYLTWRIWELKTRNAPLRRDEEIGLPPLLCARAISSCCPLFAPSGSWHWWLHLGAKAKPAEQRSPPSATVHHSGVAVESQEARQHGPRGFLSQSWLLNLSVTLDGRSIGNLHPQATISYLEFIPCQSDFKRYPKSAAAGGCQWDWHRRWRLCLPSQ